MPNGLGRNGSKVHAFLSRITKVSWPFSCIELRVKGAFRRACWSIFLLAFFKIFCSICSNASRAFITGFAAGFVTSFVDLFLPGLGLLALHFVSKCLVRLAPASFNLPLYLLQCFWWIFALQLQLDFSLSIMWFDSFYFYWPFYLFAHINFSIASSIFFVLMHDTKHSSKYCKMKIVLQSKVTTWRPALKFRLVASLKLSQHQSSFFYSTTILGPVKFPWTETGAEWPWRIGWNWFQLWWSGWRTARAGSKVTQQNIFG